MDETQIAAAAASLQAHGEAGTVLPALPSAMRPATRREGYAIQALIETRSASPLFGWKIAATSAAGQAHIGVDGPIAGRLLSERVFADGAELPAGPNRMRVAEAEFAFRFGRDLMPRATSYSVDDVLSAVATLHPAIEVPDSRFDDFASVGGPQLIADNACAQYFVLGAPTDADWRAIDLAAHRITGRLERGLTREGIGANVLGDPRIALAWLVNEVTGLGLTVSAGQTITTGTCLVPIEIAPGDVMTADFGVLGRVSVRFPRDLG